MYVPAVVSFWTWLSPPLKCPSFSFYFLKLAGLYQLIFLVIITPCYFCIGIYCTCSVLEATWSVATAAVGLAMVTHIQEYSCCFHDTYFLVPAGVNQLFVVCLFCSKLDGSDLLRLHIIVYKSTDWLVSYWIIVGSLTVRFKLVRRLNYKLNNGRQSDYQI